MMVVGNAKRFESLYNRKWRFVEQYRSTAKCLFIENGGRREI
jgi:hypothetical protein